MNEYFPVPLEFREAGIKNGSTVFQLIHYFQYVSSIGTITVPTGFTTDGASIPRCFWNVLGPYGPYFKAAVIHDWLYSWKSKERGVSCTREQADLIFKEAMYNIGVGWVSREIIYRAVQMFGGSSFRVLPQ